MGASIAAVSRPRRVAAPVAVALAVALPLAHAGAGPASGMQARAEASPPPGARFEAPPPPVDRAASAAARTAQPAAGGAPPGASAPVQVESMFVVRSSPLAGFQFHAAQTLWLQLQVGDRLDLVRERDNPHDSRAIRVQWRGVKLGYVPRRDNAQVARQMDLGAPLEARISRLRESRNPWDRIEFEVVLTLGRTGTQSPVSSP